MKLSHDSKSKYADQCKVLDENAGSTESPDESKLTQAL